MTALAGLPVRPLPRHSGGPVEAARTGYGEPRRGGMATVRLASAIYAQGVLVEASGSRATVWDGGRCWEGERVTP